ncbi:MAG: hypothetical protein V4719_26585 [Planctomycetota bacterium]
MATDLQVISDLAGGNVYYVVWNAARQLLDWSDHTFKSAGSATTKGLVGTESTDGGGAIESAYIASIDLAYLNATPAIAAFWVDAMRRTGGAINLAADLLLDTQQVKVSAGSIVANGSPGDIPPGYVVKVGMNVTSTAGNFVQVYAAVTFNGQPVTLGEDDTCVFDCFEFETELSQFGGGTDPVGPASSNQFETIVANPNFVDDCEYNLKATVVISGVTLRGEDFFPVIGSA